MLLLVSLIAALREITADDTISRITRSQPFSP